MGKFIRRLQVELDVHFALFSPSAVV
jgi:hypothetical protein